MVLKRGMLDAIGSIPKRIKYSNEKDILKDILVQLAHCKLLPQNNSKSCSWFIPYMIPETMIKMDHSQKEVFQQDGIHSIITLDRITMEGIWLQVVITPTTTNGSTQNASKIII
jgi:hypothetical protein